MDTESVVLRLMNILVSSSAHLCVGWFVCPFGALDPTGWTALWKSSSDDSAEPSWQIDGRCCGWMLLLAGCYYWMLHRSNRAVGTIQRAPTMHFTFPWAQVIFFWPKDLKGYIFDFIYFIFLVTLSGKTLQKKGLLFKIVSNKCVYVK